MSWKRPVSVCVLAILTGLPVSGAMCAVMCESAASSTASVAGHNHGPAGNVEEAAPAISVHIQTSDHGCTHDAALQQASTTAAERADRSIIPIPLATTSLRATFKALINSGPAFECSTRPAASPPTTTPLVLRV